MARTSTKSWNRWRNNLVRTVEKPRRPRRLTAGTPEDRDIPKEWKMRTRQRLLDNRTPEELQVAAWLADARVKFKEQWSIGPYFVDFVIGRVVLELDGDQHRRMKSYDRQRTAYLKKQGYRVRRLWNYQVNQPKIFEIVGASI